MAFRRRYRRRSSRKVRRPTMRSRYSLGSQPSLISHKRRIMMKKHHFKQMYFPAAASFSLTGTNSSYDPTTGLLIGPGVTAGTTDCKFSIMFRLVDIPQVVSFTNLFDAYRINKVVVRFEPQQNAVMYNANANGGNVAQTPFLTTVIDKDDNNIVTPFTAMMEYESFKETPGYRRHTRVLVPACSMDAFKTTGTTIGYVQRHKVWIDTAYTDLEHYSVKGYIQANANANTTIIWKVFVTMYVSFKQVR